MLASVGTIAGNLHRLGDILLQVVACRCGIGLRLTIEATDEGLERYGVSVGPGVTIAGYGQGETLVAILIGFRQVLGGTVATTTTGTGTRNAHGEVVGLEVAVLCRHTASEDDLTHSGGITPTGITDEQAFIVVGELHATGGARVDHGLVELGSFLPETTVVVGIEERAGMIESSTGTQGKDSQVVGTAVVGRRHGQVAQVAIILRDFILDGLTLRVDECKHLIGSGTWLHAGLVGRHILGEKRHTTILTHQQEVEVGSQETSLPLVIIILVHLGLEVFVECIVLELQAGELVEEQVAIGNAMIACGPDGAVGIGGTPSTVVETLNGISRMRVDRLVGGRREHGPTVVAEVGVEVGIDGGEETACTLELFLHIGRIIDTELLIVHLLATGGKCYDSKRT